VHHFILDRFFTFNVSGKGPLQLAFNVVEVTLDLIMELIRPADWVGVFPWPALCFCFRLRVCFGLFAIFLVSSSVL